MQMKDGALLAVGVLERDMVLSSREDPETICVSCNLPELLLANHPSQVDRRRMVARVAPAPPATGWR